MSLRLNPLSITWTHEQKTRKVGHMLTFAMSEHLQTLSPHDQWLLESFDINFLYQVLPSDLFGGVLSNLPSDLHLGDQFRLPRSSSGRQTCGGLTRRLPRHHWKIVKLKHRIHGTGIFTYIWLIFILFMQFVQYTSPMDPMGLQHASRIFFCVRLCFPVASFRHNMVHSCRWPWR